MIRLLLSLGLVVIFNISVFAHLKVQDSEGNSVPARHPHWEGFYLEQDLFVGDDNEDRNYTMGLGINLSVPTNANVGLRLV